LTPSISEPTLTVGCPVISVRLLITEVGRLTTEVAQIVFYAVPIQREGDFHCIPPNLLSFLNAKAISNELAESKIKGRIGRYEWRKEI
jgi:hypothetical protein